MPAGNRSAGLAAATDRLAASRAPPVGLTGRDRLRTMSLEALPAPREVARPEGRRRRREARTAGMASLDRPKLRPLSAQRVICDGQTYAALADPLGVFTDPILIPI